MYSNCTNSNVISAASIPKTKSKAPSQQPKTDVTNGVANLTIQEGDKIKSKNIDVLSEYNKTQQKNAANFVVIGK